MGHSRKKMSMLRLACVLGLFAVLADAAMPAPWYEPAEGYEAYQIGVLSFIVLLFAGYYAVYAVMGIDYSGDTLLLVTEPLKED
eukprot:NODE_3886_length_341_cov_51.472603_g3804_i0.p1 GENE.NODE_3886_length_341_cov_51.472603_g3804_i0~~NODE_3886_length_341_cov_51.472603_g3804_i0.p1  ORF type:complete len:91 (+),score=26.27 NODE_3886_length_341_cov_51.472603_g3804_i0:24-275(+)